MNSSTEHRVFPINGLDLHVTLAGDGEPLLLLHGFPDSARLWRKMIPGLVAAGFRIIAPDQRGFGQTTAPAKTGDYSIIQIAADAIALLDTLGVKRAALMAHDWGAVIGWRLAADHPDRFTCFVALSIGHPNAVVHSDFRQKLKSWYFGLFLLRGIGEAVVRAFDFMALSLMTRNDSEIRNWRNDLSRPGRLTAGMNWYRANLFAMAKSDFPAARIPVLGLIGDNDVALNPQQMEQSQRYMEAPFRCEVIEGAGHWMPVHSVAKIERRAVAFLKSGR